MTQQGQTIPINFSDGTFGKEQINDDANYESDLEVDEKMVKVNANLTPTFGVELVELQAEGKREPHPKIRQTQVKIEPQPIDTFEINKKIIAIKPPVAKQADDELMFGPKENTCKNSRKNQFFQKFIEKPLLKKKEAIF